MDELKLEQFDTLWINRKVNFSVINEVFFVLRLYLFNKLLNGSNYCLSIEYLHLNFIENSSTQFNHNYQFSMLELLNCNFHIIWIHDIFSRSATFDRSKSHISMKFSVTESRHIKWICEESFQNRREKTQKAKIMTIKSNNYWKNIHTTKTLLRSPINSLISMISSIIFPNRLALQLAKTPNNYKKSSCPIN